jgi:competence ComEA-like helix-hairpin-helix protein
MIKKLGILALILFLFSNASAECNETQIDINTANLTELDEITQIGPAKAQAIIDSRPFSSVDDLIKVSGIGNKTLDKIKAEGLACVREEAESEETESNEEESTSNISETNSSIDTTEETETSSSTAKTKATEPVSNLENEPAEEAVIKPISLNAQNIKSENNNENLGKNLPLYGIGSFCVLFGALFFLKFARRKSKNEFR